MSPAILKEPLVLRWGVPFAGTVTLVPGGSPMDLTGLKATASLHRGTPQNPGEAVYDITTDNGLLEINGVTDGVIQFALGGGDIEGFDIGDYVMLFFVTDGSGAVVANGHPLIRYVQVLPSGVSPGVTP